MPACATPDLFASETFNDLAPREHRNSPVEQMGSATYPNIVLRVDESLDATPNNNMWAARPSFHSKVLNAQWPSTVWTPQPTELQEGLAIIFPDTTRTPTMGDSQHKEGLMAYPLSSQPDEGFTNHSGLARSGIIYENPFVSRPQEIYSQTPRLRGVSSPDWGCNEPITGPATHENRSERSHRDEEQSRRSAPENCTFSSPMGASELPEPQLRNLWEALYEIKRIAAATARRDIEDQRTHLGETFDDGTVPWVGFYDWRLSSQLVVPYCPVHLVPPTPNQRLLLSVLLTGEGGRS